MTFLNILGYSDLSSGPSVNALAFHRFIQKTTDKTLLIVNGQKSKKSKLNGSDESDDPSILYYNVFKEQDSIRKLIDESDVVVIHAIPFPFQGYVDFNDDDKLTFIDMLKYVKDSNRKLFYYEYAHESSCITRYNFLIDPKYCYAYSLFDGTIAYSKDKGIGELYYRNSISPRNFICIGSGVNNIFSFDFERNKERFWKNADQKLYKSIHFLGRSCPYKGTWLFRDLHWNYFKDAGYISIIEGVIYSIGTLPQLYTKMTAPKIPRIDVFLVPTRKDELKDWYMNPKFERNNPAYMFPTYEHDEGLNRLSRSQFGISMLLFKDKYLEETFENTMLEMVSVGTIPIYRKKWAESFKINGKSLVEHGSENVGMLFLDENDPMPTVEQMNKIADDIELYEQYRNRAYEFVNSNLGLDAVYSKIVDKIKNVCNSGGQDAEIDDIWSL